MSDGAAQVERSLDGRPSTELRTSSSTALDAARPFDGAQDRDEREIVRAERAAVAAYAARQCGQIDALIARGRVGAEEGGLLKDRLRAFAGDIRAGLHVQEEERG